MPVWEAWAEAGRLMDAHGRAPAAAEMQAAIGAARAGWRADPWVKERSAGSLYLVLRALRRWSDHEGMLWLAPMQVRDDIKALTTDPREEEALTRALAGAVARLEVYGSFGAFVATDARAVHAVALLRLPEADAREAGRTALAEQVKVMEALIAGGLVIAGKAAEARLVASAEMLHAMAVNNLAQAWEQRVEGGRADNLRRAIAEYERCCGLRARVAEPEKLLHSLHHLALCLRLLAHELEGLERSELLERAREVAQQGLMLAKRHPGCEFPMLDPLRLNLANTEAHLLLEAVESGEMTEDEADRRLREHAGATLAWMRGSSLHERMEGRGAEPFFAQFVGEVDGMEAAAAALLALVDRLARGGPEELRFITRDEASQALSAMMALTPGGVASPLALRPDVHQCLPVVMGALHPLHAGVAAARGLYAVEIAWIGPRLRALGWLGRKYIEDALAGMHRYMCDADLPDAHRRLFAAQVGQLAGLALDPEVGLVGLDGLDRIRFHDLTGAAFYRAESTIYGQGPSHAAPLASEPGWRISLYRARQTLDHCALLHTYEELRPLAERVQPGVLDQVVAAMRTYRVDAVDGSEAREFRDIGDPMAEMSELRAEILEYRRYGQQFGWPPAFVETTPAPRREEIAAWLRERPTAALLIAGGAELGLAYAAGEEMVSESFAGWCGETWAGMLGLAGELTRAWTMLLHESEEAGKALGELDTALREVRADRGWRALTERIAGALRGRTCVTVVERGIWRAFPWGGLPLGEGALGDAVAFVHVPTLANSGAREAPLRAGTLAYVGAAEGVMPELELGRAVFGEVGGPLGREVFERACAGVGVIRVFAHGEFNGFDAPVSGFMLDAGDEEDLAYQGYEVATIDLGGCGRVELWACESGVQSDFLGELLGNDEPLGIASCFLLAGARVVVGSLWKQPAIVAGLIAAAFIGVAGPPGSAERDARALGRALAAYRRAVEEGGVLERAFCGSIATALRGSTLVPGAVNRAIRAGWCAAAEALCGRGPIDVPLAAIPEHADGGLASLRSLLNEPEQLEEVLREGAWRILDPLFRRPAAWAGWRVLARDRSVI